MTSAKPFQLARNLVQFASDCTLLLYLIDYNSKKIVVWVMLTGYHFLGKGDVLVLEKADIKQKYVLIKDD